MSDGPRKPRRRRTWPQRLLLTFNVLVVFVCFASAGGLLYVFRQTTNVARFSLSTTLNQTTKKGEPENFLLVGIDSAAGIDPNDPINIGRGATNNTDTIMILRVDPGSDKAQLLSLPRDLWVRIAGTDYHEKINAALATGGPQRLIETIQQNFGIPINHFVQVNFEAFRSLVDAVGGIPIYFPWPARDCAHRPQHHQASGASPSTACRVLPTPARATSRASRTACGSPTRRATSAASPASSSSSSWPSSGRSPRAPATRSSPAG